jgi:hypothetical protein
VEGCAFNCTVTSISTQPTRYASEIRIDLVREGLASVGPERMISGAKQIEVARVRITEAGRKVLDETRL